MIRIFHYLSYLGRWGSVPVVRDETVTVAFVPLMVHVLSHAYFCLSPSVIRRSYGSLDLKNLRELNTCKQKHSWVLGCWRLKLQESGWKIETADSSNMRKNTAFLSRFSEVWSWFQPRMASAENGDLEKILQEILGIFGNTFFGICLWCKCYIRSWLCSKYTLIHNLQAYSNWWVWVELFHWKIPCNLRWTCATAIFLYARCWFSGEHILCVKALEAFTNTTTCSGEAATHDNNPMFGENPVASMWLPVGTDFLEVEMEQSDSSSVHQACQSCFSYSKWRKRTCSRPKRTPNSSGKRQGFWGVWVVLGLASIGHDRAGGFDMPTSTEWCLRGLQRRTLEAWSWHYKPCWFIYVYIFEFVYIHVCRMLWIDPWDSRK